MPSLVSGPSEVEELVPPPPPPPYSREVEGVLPPPLTPPAVNRPGDGELSKADGLNIRLSFEVLLLVLLVLCIACTMIC